MLVGEAEEYLVHKHILLDIPHFNRCLRNGWREAQEGSWRLPDEEPTAFEEVVNFLYHGRFTYDLAGLMRNDSRPSEGQEYSRGLSIGKKSLNLMKVYVMGVKWGYEKLQNAALDALFDSFALSPINSEEYEYVLENTTARDGLRKNVLMQVARDVRRDGWEAFEEDEVYQHCVRKSFERLEELMEAIAGSKEGKAREKGKERCEVWHVHNVTSKCS